MGKYYKQLTYNDRLTLEKMLNQKKFTKQEIADTIGCTRITIYREIKKGTVSGLDTQLKEIYFYAGDAADRITKYNKSKQGAKLKAINDKELLEYISKKIEIDRYSPRATIEYIKKHNLRFKTTISDFTIYRYIKKGYFENLTMDKLPYEKTYHKRYLKIQKIATIGQSIEKRPLYILNRSEFGHWEMDSVVGSEDSKKSLLVLSERKTRKELIFLNNNMTTQEVVNKIDLLEQKLGKHFKAIFKSITVDNGREFCNVNGLSKSIINKNQIRTQMYYCHAYHPEERGTNENINKMIRKYLPKGYNFDNEEPEYIKFIQEEINNYPRKIFNYNTANDMFRKELKKLHIPKNKRLFLFID